MVVSSLRIKKIKGAPAERVSELRLIVDIGVKGDANAGSATRQVCVISSRASAARETDGLCSAKFHANIEPDEAPESGWRTGVRFRIGEALMDIESVGKKCYPECEAFRRAGPCVLARECAFARVVRDGVVRVGDRIAAE